MRLIPTTRSTFLRFAVCRLLGAFALTALFGLSTQAQVITGYHYKIKRAHFDPIYYTQDEGGTATAKHLCRAKLKGQVTQSKTGDTLFFNFWGLTQDASTCLGTEPANTIIRSTDALGCNRYYYFVTPECRETLGDVTSYTAIPFGAWDVGVITIPIKHRFGSDSLGIPNDAAAKIDGGLYVGYKFGWTRFYRDPLLRHSYAWTVGLIANPIVIPPLVEGTNSKHAIHRSANELGIDGGVAVMYTNRDVTGGVIGGVNFPVSGESWKWYYAYRPWIGFGLGLKLATIGDK